MTIIPDIHLNLQRNQILRRVGIRHQSSVRPEVTSLIDDLLFSINDKHLLKPICAYKIITISGVDRDQISLTGNTVLNSPLLASVLSDAKGLAVAVCTIGSELEKQVTDYIRGGNPLRGLLLDGIGSAAVDSLSQEVCKLIQNEASFRGRQASSPYSPGILGFPITEQWQLFRLVPAEKIGVRLTVSGLMVPHKSVSMVIALGEQVPVRKQGEACAYCNLSKTCIYKLTV